MFQALITSRRFAPLFWCQFLSALNDNFVKNALVILILFKAASDQGGALVALAGAVLVAPFFILSGIGGELADRYDKAVVAEKLKRAEIPVALIAAVGFILNSIPVLFAALFCYGVIAALFGPIKYGILPALLAPRELPAGNAFVESATFAAILFGTIGGGMAASDTNGVWVLAGLVVGLAVLCWFSASLIPKMGAAAPGLTIDFNPWTSTVALIQHLRSDRRLWVGGLITSWFWLVGTVVLSLLPVLIKDAMGGGESVTILALVVFTIGIAIGSAIAARASKTRPNLALVPIGALLMGCFALDLALTASTLQKSADVVTVGALLSRLTGWHILLDLAGLAIAGGFFIVPAFAAVQLWAPETERARTIGACNVLSALFMTVASLGIALLQWAGAGLALLLAVLGAANIAVMVLILRAWGKEGIQDVGAFLFKTFMGLEVKGYENLPPAGTRAIIAPNHVSLLDAPIMHSILPSHAAFAIDTGMAQKSWIKPFLKVVKAHSIDPTKPLGTRHLIQAVKGGETLVIFPEGRLTVTGGLMKVYDGTAMIADKADAVIVPVRIDGPERSYFGYLNRFQCKKALFPKTTVTILPPLKLAVSEGLKGKARRQAAGMALQDVMVEAAVKTANLDQTLFSALVEAKATRDTGKPAIEDPLGTKLSYGKLILGAQVLGTKLAPLAPEGAAVGVMLPNSAGVAVCFFALQTIGRVPAMLNFTAGPQNIEAACTAANVDVVLTSRVFVEKAHLEAVVDKLSEKRKVVYLEDVKASIRLADKLRGLLVGSRAQVARAPNDPAAILFTSGSEGLPKGVVLSHRNMLANAMQSLTRVAVNGQDKVFNVLPVFHSFGLTAGLVMPLVAGVPVYLYPTPLHYRIVPELVYGSNATILFGTDTFLNGYARCAHPYDFARVRLILAGAEAVKERTRQIYMEKFGVRILEGYGVTETAPVLAINTPLANKAGTVGRLSPLMEARLEPVPGIEGAGRLYVRGPNVMLGYMRVENPGVLEPPADGWHDTGDIVAIDDQGFITIKGRAKRFAKIAGEMVSLSAVEALATELWPTVTSVVVALPDARKGERLVLMTTDTKATRDAFARFARQKGANELMVPADILIVPSVPLLGSGKPDYVASLALAKDRMASAPRKAEALVPEPIVGPSV
ncbi:acyl-[ACP]--phospholipid O-acyltransferase [Hyphomicrobium sp.]|uniref:acyl-[ACP]--phospholipid O-acyltransferase n=1 Tax=Hyphomicrobium sp. TaxID=82 RepID=UPI002E3133A0|nr:acyl-[ACP]--phospholipid O-acyltransferase [Hyphomicrobium sp.]HEX2842949.1 acyl-[ACP]--phospholipid O-acyltransferase [Hyphomicrobium sp.]